MERTHTPLSVWFLAAYLVASQTSGMSAVQFQRQLGLQRYETAFQILHKLRASMVRPDLDRIGGNSREHVEADETYVGRHTRGKGRSVHDMVLVAGVVRNALASRRTFFEHLRALIHYLPFDDWNRLMRIMGKNPDPVPHKPHYTG